MQDALRFGHSAPQPKPGGALGALDSWYNTTQPVSEDCLFLNVFTAALTGRRPVMVWLHGGGWTACSGTAPGFDGTNVARDGDVVVVTLNHRINLFGAINLGATDERFVHAGTAGVLDMVAALRWVRDNIANFGGDPANVTIFGQSGGAAKVTALMAMPAARGLLHKAIAENCSGRLRLDSQAESARQAAALAQAIGVESTGAALQRVPMGALIRASHSVHTPFRPVLDGKDFPPNPFDPAAPDLAADLPLMIGNAATEATLFMAGNPENFALPAAEVERRVARYLHLGQAAAHRLVDAYNAAMPGTAPSYILAQIGTDYMYRRNRTRAATLQAGKATAPVYAYVFDWETPVMGGRLHSPHTPEVPFVFGTTAACSGIAGTGPELQDLTSEVRGRWSAFAHTGQPNREGLLPWPAYTAQGRATMMLGTNPAHRSGPGAPRPALTRWVAVLRVRHANQLRAWVSEKQTFFRRMRKGRANAIRRAVRSACWRLQCLAFPPCEPTAHDR